MPKSNEERTQKNNDWWAEQMAAAQDALTQKKIEETEAQIKSYYQKAMNNAIRGFGDTYAKLLETVEQDRAPTPADLYKLDTYWKQQAELAQVLEDLGNKEAKLLSKKFMEEFKQIYEEIALKDDLFFSEVDTQIAQQLINEIWARDGKSWSARIWDNRNRLKQALNDGLVECVINGAKPSNLKKRLMKEFGVAFKRADRLVRTEMAHIQTQAARERYKNAGLRYVEVWADKDERRCDICGGLHKKHYPIGGVMPVPAHPNCRCCILPVIDEQEQLTIDGFY